MEQKEYIERDAAIKARGRSCDKNCKECDFAIEGDSWCNGEVFVVDLLRVPAADVRPVVRGHWERTLWFVTCSVCGYTSADTDDEGSDISLNFCPNCGADMREEP